MKASVTCKLFPWTIDINKTGGHDKSLKAAHRNLLVYTKLKIYQANNKYQISLSYVQHLNAQQF